MAKKGPPDDVSIGKFDILATYTYAGSLLDGLDDDEAKQQGMVAAIMGAQARLGVRREHHEEYLAQKEAAEKKKKTTITAESFDQQVADKMGEFFDGVFLPTMKKLIEAGLSYDEVKRAVKIPSTWGAKIRGEQFRKRPRRRCRRAAGAESPDRLSRRIRPTQVPQPAASTAAGIHRPAPGRSPARGG
jgi:hypothetical protein